MAKIKRDVRAEMKKRGEFAKVHEMERTYMVVAVMLSDFPQGTQFNSRSRKSPYLEYYLDDQISRLLSEWREHPAIKNIFSFDYKCEHWCEEVKRYLDCPFRYGQRIGLENRGGDCDYVIDNREELMKVAEEARVKMPARDFEFFRKLGREIVYDGGKKLPDKDKRAKRGQR